MGASQSTVKPGSPLGIMCQAWERGKLPGTAGLTKKKMIKLCQEDWPNLCTRWPLTGSFNLEILKQLRLILEQRKPQQMDYWFLWDDEARRSNPKEPLAVPPPYVAPPSAPEGPKGSQVTMPTGLYPLVGKPSVVCSRMATATHPAENSTVVNYLHHPFKPKDLVLWAKTTPKLSEDPPEFLRVFDTICQTYNPTVTDLHCLCSTLLSPAHVQELRRRVTETLTANPLAGTVPLQINAYSETCPENIDYNLTMDRTLLKEYRKVVQETMKAMGQRTVNWSKVKALVQEKEESPADFMNRLTKTIRMFGGVNPEAEANRALVVSLFVDQSAPDIREYFLRHQPGWQGNTLAQILTIAQHVFAGREERSRKQADKKKKEDLQMLAAMFVPGGRGRGGGRGRRGRGGRTGRGGGRGGGSGGLDSNVCKQQGSCFKCGSLDHWKNECPMGMKGNGSDLGRAAAALMAQGMVEQETE